LQDTKAGEVAIEPPVSADAHLVHGSKSVVAFVDFGRIEGKEVKIGVNGFFGHVNRGAALELEDIDIIVSQQPVGATDRCGGGKGAPRHRARPATE
jgi:hypothetical protein